MSDDNRKKYEPLLDSAENEKTASGKCKWIISVLRMMTQNDLYHLCLGQAEIKKEVTRRTNKIMVMLISVMAIVLVTNPQVGKLLKSFWILVF